MYKAAFVELLIVLFVCVTGGCSKKAVESTSSSEAGTGEALPAKTNSADPVKPSKAQPKVTTKVNESVLSSPAATWRALEASVKERNAVAFWALFGAKAKAQILDGRMGQRIKNLPSLPDEALSPLATAVGVSVAAIRAMGDDALARTVMFAEALKNEDTIVGAKWLGATVNGESAIATTRDAAGQERRWRFGREAGSWRFLGPATKP